MKPQSAKAKGRRLQKEVVASILGAFAELEPDDVTSRSMGAGGEDVLLSPAARRLVPLTMECKNQEGLSIWAALKQAESHQQAQQPGVIPAVVFTRNHHRTYIALPLEDMMRILQERAWVHLRPKKDDEEKETDADV